MQRPASRATNILLRRSAPRVTLSAFQPAQNRQRELINAPQITNQMTRGNPIESRVIRTITRLPLCPAATAVDRTRPLPSISDASLAGSASLLVQPGGKLRDLPGLQVGAITDVFQRLFQRPLCARYRVHGKKFLYLLVHAAI